MGARDGAPAEERRLLLSTDPSEANVAALRALIEERAPRVAPLFGDDELRRYFDRRTFRGAIVECNRVHVGEWLVLLGDAAHSVLPPTGEGINSGLEDAMVTPRRAHPARRTAPQQLASCTRTQA
jgi:kynurenine 3-monooxygenase